jgi:hypothetical protein
MFYVECNWGSQCHIVDNNEICLLMFIMACSMWHVLLIGHL